MKQVLIVDDAATVRHYHREILRRAGWQVEEACNGIAALESILSRPASQPYDLLLVDVNMPGMDGHSFLRSLRREAGHGGAPVVMVSSVPAAAGPADAPLPEVNAYLHKPVSPPQLVLTAALLMGDCAAAQAAAGEAST